jgi:hypothetical protein
MMATIAWDQTLLGAAISVLLAGLAYVAAARILGRQELARELRLRRDALEQVLGALEGPAAAWLADPSDDYPQREMLELERRALQAQILFWRDLALQRALQGVSDPARHAPAAEALRVAAARLDVELRALGAR